MEETIKFPAVVPDDWFEVNRIGDCDWTITTVEFLELYKKWKGTDDVPDMESLRKFWCLGDKGHQHDGWHYMTTENTPFHGSLPALAFHESHPEAEQFMGTEAEAMAELLAQLGRSRG